MSEFKKIEQLEKQLWSAADSLSANTGLTAQEYSRCRGSSDIKSKIQAKGAMYVPDDAMYSNLLALLFDTYCSKFWDQIKVLDKKNENLKKQLDMLLSKLLSGKIEL
ncbi:hypothetical protein CEG15_13250 [Vibrio anguillarum]|uniref:hypothetical protein n=1 Tax=Vibrio anguillarum TaxID=55601 RepID=UPI000B53E355|nr:hypothetical protein [Vibrio anguillarum]ASG01086.1 hypothetical protein CEG15_13250 [Vibrio anguillarum]